MFSASEKIYIDKSQIPNSGRGVFAKQSIKKNELIEKCPTIEIADDDPSDVREGILITYFFYAKKTKYIALGFGSIYNHTRNPNAIYKINEKEKTIDFIAIKDIEKKEEITVNYNYLNPKDKTPMWFEEN